MIQSEVNPMGWSFLMDELEDAQEHLTSLIKELNTDPEYGEGNLRLDLGHIYSHLNRAWHRRNVPEDLTEAEWASASQFPKDLDPT